MSRGWLSVFAKAPAPGRVKTRLSPPLSLEQAAALYDAMLADVLVASAEFAHRLSLEPVLHFDPPASRATFVARTPAAYRLLEQRGQGLAVRMANAFAEAHAAGAEWLLLRGSDSPALDFERVAQANAALDRDSDVVIVPDQGGGYALLGLKEPRIELFDMSMSTASVLEETIARAESLGLRVRLIRPTFDVDVGADLALLAALPIEQTSVLCPRTVENLLTLRRLAVL